MALVLHEDDVRILLTMPDTVDVLETAFAELASGGAVNHPRDRVKLTNGVLHLLAAGVPSMGVLGFKTYTSFRGGMRYLVMLFSAQDGSLLAMIEADWLGRMRTGATSALATKYLARPNCTRVGLIGAGKQAATQLMGMCVTRPISSVVVYSRTAQHCKIFCDEMSRLLGIDVQPVEHARQAVEGVDILITATTSHEPVFSGEWLEPGCHINAIGSNWPTKRELDPVTLQRCFLAVTDSREQAMAEAGDFIIPIGEGLFDWEQVYALADVVAGSGPQREAPEDITLYKGLGVAIEDVATAAHVYKLALEQGLGKKLSLLT